MRFLPHRRAARLLVVFGLCAGAFALPNVTANAAPRETLTRHGMKTLWQNNSSAMPPASKTSRTRTNGISYHGRPVILGTTNVYVIWYGSWPAASTTPSIITNLLSSIGGSPYFNINTTTTTALAPT